MSHLEPRDPPPAISKTETAQPEGRREVMRTVGLFHLDAIIAGGGRVNSYQAKDFRVLAKTILREGPPRATSLGSGKGGEEP